MWIKQERKVRSVYEPSLGYERTAEQRSDQVLSWERSDKAFFASGACHILAFTFKGRTSRDADEIVYIKPAAAYDNRGTHVYVRSGGWAFDFNGWTKEAELLQNHAAAYRRVSPGWTCEPVVITSTLAEFCANYRHRLPADFAHSPLGRANSYIDQFSLDPPHGSGKMTTY